MRTLFIILALVLALAITLVALANDHDVVINYLVGQISLTVFQLILISALAGVLVMVFFSIYRSIHNYMRAQGDRDHRRELQRRIKILEDEKKKLQTELAKFRKERENAISKAHAQLEVEKKKLEAELERQKAESDRTAAKEQAALETEKRKLEDELKKQQREQERLAAKSTKAGQPKKSLLDIFKKEK